MNYEELFTPTKNDKPYVQANQLRISLIARIDSYKFSHHLAYPDGIKAMSSYGECRVGKDTDIVPFGMQLLLKKYLTQSITMDDIDATEKFTIAHFGRKLFAREAWEKVVTEYNGELPLIIRAVPEGTVVSGGLPLYSVTVLDSDLFWMSAGFETLIQRGIWYPTTIATMDFEIKKVIRGYYEKTGADKQLLPFSYHDFGGRGVSSPETAEIGGAAHLVNFMGSDTVEGILTANFYYKEAMAGFSVYATEHSIECSFGAREEDAVNYLRKQLSNAPEGSVLSVVIDGYDMYRNAKILCTTMKDEIIASKAKVVFRPDSGDMMHNVPWLLALQAEHFGTTKTDKGFTKINHVGVIQGDGICHDSLTKLLSHVVDDLGYSADVVIFGSGGALLQKVNRDTFKFAQKASAKLTDDGWIGIAKNPITDQGKKSKEGILTTVRDKKTGELSAWRLDKGPLPENVEDIMQLVYHTGTLYNEITFATVRENVASTMKGEQ